MGGSIPDDFNEPLNDLRLYVTMPKYLIDTQILIWFELESLKPKTDIYDILIDDSNDIFVSHSVDEGIVSSSNTITFWLARSVSIKAYQ